MPFQTKSHSLHQFLIEGITPKVHIQIRPPLRFLHAVSLRNGDPRKSMVCVCALVVPFDPWSFQEDTLDHKA